MTAAGPFQNARVFVVEDDPLTLQVLCGVLERAGYTPTGFAHPRDALEQVAASAPDAVVTDLHLPGFDGLALAAALWRTLPRLPILIVTADRQRRAQARRAGVLDYLLKPVNEEELVYAIRRVMSEAREPDSDFVAAVVALLSTIADALEEAPEREDLYILILSRIGRLFAADRCSLLLRHPDGESLVLAAALGLPPDVTPRTAARLASPVAERVIELGRPMLFIRSVRDYSDFKDLPSDESLKAAICAPMTHAGRVRGVLNIATVDERKVLTPRDLEVAHFLAAELGALFARQDARAERDRLRDQACASERLTAMGLIATGIAHDLRSPLTALSMNVEMLLQEQESPSRSSQAELEALATDIREGIEACRVIASDVLRGVRAPSPEDAPVEATPFGELLRRAWRVTVSGSLPAGINHELDLPPDLPPVRIHALALTKILSNLVSNAVDALQGARGTGMVTVRARVDAAGVSFSVVDDGPGMSPEIAHRVFQPLFSTKHRDQGSGLGLAIVKHSAAETGGEVSLHTELGKGTRVTVSWPASVIQSAST